MSDWWVSENKKILRRVCITEKILGFAGLEVYSPATPRTGVRIAKGGGVKFSARRTNPSANYGP